MPEGYLPILVMLVVATGFAGIALGVPALLGPRRNTLGKNMPIESGMLSIGEARRRFPVQFYMVAVLYILFDVETILLYPWAVAARKLGMFGLIEMAIFILILIVGFVYHGKTARSSGIR